ncbi:MAG: hypothetical protein H0T73_10095, partial [Ardenticatenales bacterium]|nr:hypothetical protein [Ardenticatenales bacterium]
EAGFGQQFRRHERGDALAGEEHHSTARRMGLGWPWRDERGVRVGRTLLGAVGLLRDGQVAEYPDGRVAVTDAAGTQVAVYDPRTSSAGDAAGTPNASSANVAALLAYHALHPSGNPYAQAFAVDLAASRSGGSPLAAMEGAEALLFGSLLTAGDTVTLGAQLQAEEPTADARSTPDAVAAEIREHPSLLAAVNAYQAGDEPARWSTQVEAANDLLADRSDHVAAPGQVWALEAATAILEASGQARCALCQGPFVAQEGESCGRCQAETAPASRASALLARLRGGPVLHQAKATEASAPAAGAAPAARPTASGATVNVVANTIVENVAAEATQATIGTAQVTVERVEAQASTAQVSQVNVSVETPPALESIFAKMEGAMGSLQEMLASVATLVQQAASVPQATSQAAPAPTATEGGTATTQVLTALVERMEALATRHVVQAIEMPPAAPRAASPAAEPDTARAPLRPWPAAEGTGSTWFDRLFTDIELPTPDFYLDRVPAALGGQQHEPDMGRRMAWRHLRETLNSAPLGHATWEG